MSAHLKVKRKSMIALSYPRILSGSLREFSFPRLIVVPLSSHEIDGVRKEKERLTAASISSGK
jgi:hypothetical protein